eukprot:3484163-Alexandrium_andersonii.AAC.2
MWAAGDAAPILWRAGDAARLSRAFFQSLLASLVQIARGAGASFAPPHMKSTCGIASCAGLEPQRFGGLSPKASRPGAFQGVFGRSTPCRRPRDKNGPVSYTHLRAHETSAHL